MYRWCIALYYVGWFIASIVVATELHGSKYFIFITHWGMILLVSYLLMSAVTVTAHFVWDHLVKKNRVLELVMFDLQDPPAIGCCCGKKQKKIVPCHLQALWILYTISSETAIVVTLFYWITFNGSVTSWPVNFHEHLFNVVPGLIDIFLTRIPIRLYHTVYLMAFAAIYIVFGGIYIAAGGTNSNGDPYIYSAINYKDNLVQSIGLNLILVFIVPFVIHLLFWGGYLLRTSLLRVKVSQNISRRNNRTSAAEIVNNTSI